MNHNDINELIKAQNIDTNFVSDGFHTFGELYEHRITLFLVLLKQLVKQDSFPLPIWKSMKHDDGVEWRGWFIVGVGEQAGEQISYHLPISKWAECDFIPERERAPQWDGHSSADVLERLKKWG
ncbi:MAG: hypothetical protein HC817_07660 [Saprospiraceae bacterium]|nr:hypothetical protein [Saprospiraceae bacterium]